MIKYKTGGYRNQIEKVECTRETDVSIFYMDRGKERRGAKSSEWGNYFDTFAHAKAYLVKKANDKSMMLKDQLDRAVQEQIQVQNLRDSDLPPAEPTGF